MLCCVVHTMDELKMTGNALLGSRPLLSFDPVCACIHTFVCAYIIVLLVKTYIFRVILNFTNLAAIRRN